MVEVWKIFIRKIFILYLAELIDSSKAHVGCKFLIYIIAKTTLGQIELSITSSRIVTLIISVIVGYIYSNTLFSY